MRMGCVQHVGSHTQRTLQIFGLFPERKWLISRLRKNRNINNANGR
jgi:hypothetical protein